LGFRCVKDASDKSVSMKNDGKTIFPPVVP
jgi:hypothetical protein